MLLRLALTAIAGLSLAATAAAQVPNTFTAGTPAKAAEVNANFLYLDGRVTALATELASGVTVANTPANPVPVTGDVRVGNTSADPANVRVVATTGEVPVRNAAGGPLQVSGTVSVSAASSLPVTITNPSYSPGAVTVTNSSASPVWTYVSNGYNSPVPVSLTNGPVAVTASSTLPVSVKALPPATPINVHFSGSNTSWVSATITFTGGLSNVYVETVAVRCPNAATVAMAGISTSTAAFPSGVTVSPLDPGSMAADPASLNVVWPTVAVAGSSVLPPTSVNLPVGTSFSFWVGNGTTPATIDCTGTAIVRPVY